MWWKDQSIAKVQRLHSWHVERDKWFHLKFLKDAIYLFHLILKLCHVGKGAHGLLYSSLPLNRVYVSTGGCRMFQKPASRVVLMGHSWYPTLTPSVRTAWLTAWPEGASDYPWVGTMGPVKCFAVPPDECLKLEQNKTEFYSPNPSHQHRKDIILTTYVTVSFLCYSLSSE